MSETKRALLEMKRHLNEKGRQNPSERFRSLIDRGLIDSNGQISRPTEQAPVSVPSGKHTRR